MKFKMNKYAPNERVLLFLQKLGPWGRGGGRSIGKKKGDEGKKRKIWYSDEIHFLGFIWIFF